MHASTLAAHRFGFSETSLQALQGDPRGWVLAQFAKPALLDERGLLGSDQVGPLTRRVLQAALGQPAVASGPAMTPPATAEPPASAASQPPALASNGSDPDRQALRRANLEALQRRWQHVIATPTPVYERWVFFWSNHFTVAATRGTTLGVVGPYEREAIRPCLGGRFSALLRAASLHPGMLLYLDNAQSFGPQSRVGRRRDRGLNENHAREMLELHTVGVDGGYGQRDVTELARLLTGWTVTREGGWRSEFNPALHEPGDKQVLGRRYREGPEAVDSLFDDLPRHPACARWLATKLARHFVADDPPAALVDALAARFIATDGDLPALAETLFSHPLSWNSASAPKLKRPEEMLLSAHRMLKLPMLRTDRAFQALAEMGQPVGRAPSPQGWPDRSEDWLAPDSLWKRVQWSAAMGAAHASLTDARQLASLSFGADLSAASGEQIARADSAGQALALLLASPEFQKR